MTIHHATAKRAEQNGVVITQHEAGGYDATIPQFNLYVWNERPQVALDEAIALRKIKRDYQTWEVVAEGDRDESDATEITVKVKRVGAFGPAKPSAAFAEAFDEWQKRLVAVTETGTDAEVEAEEKAQEADAEEADERAAHSVVHPTYRARYAEAGHPTHCGDWLAETLNAIVGNRKGTDLELFEHICKLNGIDTSKYNRSTPGWQGRIRMTGRNMLARAVAAQGFLALPETIREGNVKADADWLAAQRFVKKAGMAA